MDPVARNVAVRTVNLPGGYPDKMRLGLWKFLSFILLPINA